jgi:hypothetical protein
MPEPLKRMGRPVFLVFSSVPWSVGFIVGFIAQDMALGFKAGSRA